jgi:predicted metallo-beta-lactamase superfamily hydrolase
MAKIKITPLAFESMGVRSMCTLVETKDLKVLVDPGVSVAPRFSLMPHPEEYAARNNSRLKMRKAAEKADVVTISHYHYDHHTPNYVDTVWCGSSPEEAKSICGGKLVLAKNTKSHVNTSQRRRGWLFQKISGKFVDRFESADGRSFKLHETELRFSDPVYHGEEGSELGWVIMLVVQYGKEKVVHTSDVQGPSSKKTLEMILFEDPDLVIVGGQPLYLSGSKVPVSVIEQSFQNLQRMVRSVPVTILDHHIVRSEDWRIQVKKVFEEAERHGNQVLTAAEYVGKESMPLESMRKSLYESEPPSPEFMKWTTMPEMERKKTVPPL